MKKKARIIDAKVFRSKILIKATVKIKGKDVEVGVYLKKDKLNRKNLEERLSRKITRFVENKDLNEILSNDYVGTDVDVEVEAEP